jgi:hypothetical protein
MRMPIQAAPVMRTFTAAQHERALQQQACNWGTCAGDAIRCATSCYPNPANPACIACLGPIWNDCRDCFGGLLGGFGGLLGGLHL